MPALAPAAQHAPARTAPATPATFRPKRPTVLSYGLGADSTAILLMFLADPAAHGLEPDLSDLIVVHAITGEEFVDSLDYVNRLVLPLLRARSVRLVQVCRGGKSDADGVLLLDDSRAPRRIHAAGPWRLSDELRVLARCRCSRMARDDAASVSRDGCSTTGRPPSSAPPPQQVPGKPGYRP